MDIEERLKLIKSPPTEEIITESELIELLQTKDKIYAYDGFEPSGLAHLGSGILRAIKIEDLLKAKIKFKILIADWYAWINNKMGGDLEKIQFAGKYLIEAWKACGVDTDKIEIVWASDLVKDSEYWKKVLQIAKITTISRMIRCSPIMGRCEKEMQYVAQILYPNMQAADPFQLNVDICQLGMDQRHATMLSREVGEKIGWYKPVCVHHHLLLGLQAKERMGKDQYDLKMSKSKPMSAIFIHDSQKEIEEKINSAYCPEKIIENNPVLDICKYIIFRKRKNILIERPKKYGGNIEFYNYSDLESYYREAKLHPLDLKLAVVKNLNDILEPVRKYFEKNKNAKKFYEIVKNEV
jgi:tyrosyl-tRNA synthetase